MGQTSFLPIVQPDRSIPVNRFVHASMLTVMLLHSILGCCWHHKHTHLAAECQSDSSSNRTVQGQIQSPHSHGGLRHTCSHHHTPVQSPVDHDSVPHHHHCEQGNCDLLMGKSWEFPQQIELMFAFEVDVYADVPMVFINTLASQDYEPVFNTAALRCAVLQVWRI
jgi:hypothetical protein